MGADEEVASRDGDAAAGHSVFDACHFGPVEELVIIARESATAKELLFRPRPLIAASVRLVITR